MQEFKYRYSISSDTLNGVVDYGSLVSEVNAAISNGDINHVFSRIETVDGDADSIDLVFRGELDVSEKSALDAVIAAHTGVPLPVSGDPVRLSEERDPLGRVVVVTDKKGGVGLIVPTHNFCDPTTWYTKSVRVVNETLTTSDSLRFDFANQNIIDLKHGKFFGEDKIIVMGDGYDVRVTVDGVPQTEKPIYGNAAYDYQVFYEDGYILFSNPQAGTVQATYSYATDSDWYLIPEPGKKISIRDAEVQFSPDLVIDDVLHFDAMWNMSMVVDRETYKTETDFIDQATGAFPVIPQYGALKTDIYGFPFRYNTVRVLSSVQGVALRLCLNDHRPYGGYRAVATFYCVVEDDA